MPGTKSDGSITIDTRLDNSGFDKGSDRLKNAVRSLKNQVNRTGDQIRNAFQFDFGQPKQSANTFMKALRGVSSEIDELGRTGKAALEGDAEALQRFQAESNAAMEKLEGMKEELNEFGKTEFMTPEYEKAVAGYEKAEEKVKKLEQALENAKHKSDDLYRTFIDSEKYEAANARLIELRRLEGIYDTAQKNGKRGIMTYLDSENGGSLKGTIKKAEDELEKLFDKFENSASYRSAQREVDKITQALEEARNKAAEMKAELEATPATFEGYESTEYEKDQSALQQVIDKLLAYRQLVREEIGSSTAPSAEWDAVQEKWQNMASLSGMIKGAFQSMASTISSGARTAGSAVLTGLQHPIQLVDRALGAAAAGAWRATSALANMAGTAIVNGLQRIANAARQAAVNLAGMVKAGIQTGLKKLGTAITNLGHRSKKSNNIVAMSFKNMLKYGLGIRSLYALFNKLRNAISSGFGELAQVDKEFNFVMSSFKTSVTALKNSVAAAIAPIVKTLLPYVTRFVDYISAALDKVGQFFAALTGQSTYAKVLPVWQDYAESVKNTGTNAKKTAAQLKKEKKAAEAAALTIAGFDDVEILKDKDKDEEETEPDHFIMSPISQAMSDLASKVRDYLKGLWDVVKQAWAQEGEKVLAAMRRALGAIKSLLGDIADTFYRVFTEGYGFAWLVSVFQLLETIFDIITAIVTEFKKAWDDDDRGYNYLASLFTLFTTINNILRDIGQAFLTAWNDGGGYALCASFLEMFTNINNLLIEIGESFRNAWNSGIGVEICARILSIMTGINNIVGNMAESIRRGWAEAGNGERIWTALLNIVNTVLAAVDRIVSATAEWAKGLDFAPLFSAFGGLLEAINPVVEIITNGLAWAWENVLLPLSGWTIEKGMPATLETLGAALKVVSAALDTLSPILTPLWENIIKPFGEIIGEAVVNALHFLTEKLTALSDWISNNQETFRTMVEIIGSFVAAWLIASVVSKIIAGITAAALLLKAGLGLLTAAFNSPVLIMGAAIAVGVLLYKNWDKIKEKAKELWKAIKDFFGKIGNAVKDAFNSALDLGKNIVDGLKKGITDFFNDPVGWIKEHIFDAFVNGIKSVFGIASPATEMKPFGQYIIEGLLNGITEFFSDPLGWIQEHIFDPIVDGIKSLFGIGEGAEGSSVLFDLGVSVITGLLGGVASLVGSVVAEFGKILTDITDGVTGLTETVSENLKALEIPESFMQDTTDLNTLLQDMYTAVDQLGQNSEISSGQLNTLYDAVGEAANKSTTASDALDRMYIACQDAGIGSDQLRDACENAGVNLGTLCDELAGAEGSVDSFAGTNEAAGDEMVEAWKTYNSGITTEVNSATANAQDKAQAMSTEVQAANTDIDTDTSQKWSSIYSSIVTAFGNVYRDVNSKMDDLSRLLHRRFESLATHLPNHFDGVGAAVATHLETLPPAVENVLNTVRMKFTEVNWTELGANIGQGIYNGLDQKRQELNTLAWNSANDMYKNACAALGIASPSKVFAWIGEMIPAGLKKGVDQAADGAIGAVTSLAGALAGEAEDASAAIRINVLETGVDGLDSMLSSFSDKVLSGFDQMISAMDDIINRTAFRIPAVATGSVTPYSARRASANDEREDLPDLLRNAILGDPGRITREDLMEILTNICRQYMNFDFYLGDEQIARHANSGNLKLDRRYRTVNR